MTAFLVTGGVGMALLLSSLLLGDLLDGLFDGFDLDTDGGSFLSGPVLGGFLAAFGFGGALATSASGDNLVVGTAAGVASGLAMGWAAWRLGEALAHMPTDEPVRIGDLRGKSASVVTPIPSTGYGEITVHHAGQLHKLHARSDGAIAAGTGVIIVDVLSTSSVTVVPERELFGTS